jgi:hypothetical protein
MSVLGLEVDLTNYSGRKDFQVTADYVDKRHYMICVRRLDSTKEGWTENLKVLAHHKEADKATVVFIGSCKTSTVKYVGVEVDFDLVKSADVAPLMEQYTVPVYPGHQQISRNMFNQMFETDVVTLPANLFAVGVKNGNVYLYNEGYELLYQIELTIKNIVCVALSKSLFSKFYFVICAEDGYMEHHYPSARNQPKQIAENEFAGKKYVTMENPAEFAVLHSNKYVLAQNNQVGTAYTFAMPDRYYFYLNRFNEYRSIHEGLAFSKKKSEIVYGSNPRGNKFVFANRRDVEMSPREYFYSDAVPKTNIVAPKWIKRSEMVKYKYILDIDGNASTWDATAWKLNSGSVIMKANSCWNQWFFDKFKAWEHYIPVKDDFSDLQEQHAWAESHQVECEQMVAACKKLFQTIYRFSTISDYIVEKLYQINSLTPYEVGDRRLFLFNHNAPTDKYRFNRLPSGGLLSGLTAVCKRLRSNDIIVRIGNYGNIDVNNFDPKDFVKRFLSFGKKVVISSEKNLWPDSLESVRYKLVSLSPADSEFKYAQCGFFCGEAGELARILEERVFEPTKEPVDAEYFAKVYVTELYDMTLDYTNKLSISTFRCTGEEINAAKAAGVPFVNWNAGR